MQITQQTLFALTLSFANFKAIQCIPANSGAKNHFDNSLTLNDGYPILENDLFEDKNPSSHYDSRIYPAINDGSSIDSSNERSLALNLSKRQFSNPRDKHKDITPGSVGVFDSTIDTRWTDPDQPAGQQNSNIPGFVRFTFDENNELNSNPAKVKNGADTETNNMTTEANGRTSTALNMRPSSDGTRRTNSESTTGTINGTNVVIQPRDQNRTRTRNPPNSKQQSMKYVFDDVENQPDKPSGSPCSDCTFESPPFRPVNGSNS